MGKNVIHYCAENGRKKCLEYLFSIEDRYDINVNINQIARGDKNRTPLMMGVESNDSDIVNILCDDKARIKAKNETVMILEYVDSKHKRNAIDMSISGRGNGNDGIFARLLKCVFIDRCDADSTGKTTKETWNWILKKENQRRVKLYKQFCEKVDFEKGLNWLNTFELCGACLSIKQNVKIANMLDQLITNDVAKLTTDENEITALLKKSKSMITEKEKNDHDIDEKDESKSSNNDNVDDYKRDIKCICSKAYFGKNRVSLMGWAAMNNNINLGKSLIATLSDENDVDLICDMINTGGNENRNVLHVGMEVCYFLCEFNVLLCFTCCFVFLLVFCCRSFVYLACCVSCVIILCDSLPI